MRNLFDAILARFNVEPYVYTLRPGALSGDNQIDQFLFQSQRGFCEHFASAFVFMMRSAGVPARVVAGYQGGEINPVNKTVIVHQFDAHAWAEVWIEGKGWVRVDPTGAVSPDRIEWGLEEAMQAEGSFLAAAPLSALRFRNVPLLNMLRLRYDAITYRWQSWVVGFDRERQFDLLQRFFGGVSTQIFAAILLGSWVLVLVPVAISLFRKKDTHPVSRWDKQYLIFCSRMAKLGLVRAPGETPGQFAQRAVAALPGLREGTGANYAPVQRNCLCKGKMAQGARWGKRLGVLRARLPGSNQPGAGGASLTKQSARKRTALTRGSVTSANRILD